MRTVFIVFLKIQVIILYIRTFQGRFFIPISQATMTKSTSISPKDEIHLLKAELDDVVMYYRYKEHDPFGETGGLNRPIRKVIKQKGCKTEINFIAIIL